MAISLGTAGLVAGQPDTQPPVAVVGEDMVVELNDTITLDGSTSYDNVGIVDWYWTVVGEVGHGISRTGETVELTCNSLGVWTVTLRVTDAAGNHDTARFNVTVLAPGAPRVDAGDDVVIDMGTTHTFDGSRCASESPITSWEWSFHYDGEEVNLSGSTPSHTFNLAGVYVVTLEVTNNLNLTDTDEFTVTVRDTEPPVANITWDGKAKVGAMEAFNASNSSDNVGIVNWTWTVVSHQGLYLVYYGDSMEHTFDRAIQYTVTLTLRDDAGNEALVDEPIDLRPEVEEDDGTIFVWIAIGLLAVPVAMVVVLILLRRTDKER